MQPDYIQELPQIGYDFSPENIERLRNDNRLSDQEIETLLLPFTIKEEQEKWYYNSAKHATPWGLHNNLRTEAHHANKGAIKHKQHSIISALTTVVGYATEAFAFTMLLNQYGGFLATSAAICGLAFLRIGNIIGKHNNLLFQGTINQFREYKHYLTTSKQADCALFLANDHDIRQCLHPKDTRQWAGNFEHANVLEPVVG